MWLRILIVTSIVVLSGCATPIQRGEPIVTGESKAYVIVALRGNMPLNEARYCGALCSAWYSFGDERTNGVHIFPVSVGDTFKINTVYSGLQAATFEGKEIEIEAPGVYYFGVILSRNLKLLYVPTPNKVILQEVIDKYGVELTKMKAFGFTWPQLDKGV